MAKASFLLPNGTSVEIEGTSEEVRELLAFYASTTGKNQPTEQKPTEQKPPETKSVISTEAKTKPDKSDIDKIVEIVKTCPEAEDIEKYVLDQTNEANRVLIPLYIIHEHFNNAYGMTTTEISDVTTALSVKVSRQNVLRVLKFTTPGFVIKVGEPPRYKINRRGIAHIKSVIASASIEITKSEVNDTSKPTSKKKVAKKRSAKTSVAKGRKAAKAGKGPQSFILELKKNNFFSEKRSIADVQKKLEEIGQIYAQNSLSAPLLRLVRSQNLQRVKENDSWFYISS